MKQNISSENIRQESSISVEMGVRPGFPEVKLSLSRHGVFSTKLQGLVVQEAGAELLPLPGDVKMGLENFLDLSEDLALRGQVSNWMRLVVSHNGFHKQLRGVREVKQERKNMESRTITQM